MANASDPDRSLDPRGTDAPTPLAMPARGWKEIAVRTWKEASEDNIGLIAAGVAFYTFLALVPLLGAVVLTYGLLAAPATVVRNMQGLTNLLPSDVAKLIGEQLMNVVQTSGGKKGIGVVIALAVTLYGARNAAGGIIQALNIAYEEQEKRGFIKVNLLALGMTVGAVLVFVAALLAVTALGFLEHLLPAAGPAVVIGLKAGSYLLLTVAAATAAAVLYRYGPSREKARWAWLTPGSVLFAIAWVLLTLGFGLYVANFGNYGATYGSLSAVVVLLTWLYLSSYALLFGAEANSELEHQTARDTTRGPEQPLGKRHAWAADHVASGSDDAGQARETGAGGAAATGLGHPPADASQSLSDDSGDTRAERREQITQALQKQAEANDRQSAA